MKSRATDTRTKGREPDEDNLTKLRRTACYTAGGGIQKLDLYRWDGERHSCKNPARIHKVYGTDLIISSQGRELYEFNLIDRLFFSCTFSNSLLWPVLLKFDKSEKIKEGVAIEVNNLLTSFFNQKKKKNHHKIWKIIKIISKYFWLYPDLSSVSTNNRSRSLMISFNISHSSLIFHAGKLDVQYITHSKISRDLLL